MFLFCCSVGLGLVFLSFIFICILGGDGLYCGVGLFGFWEVFFLRLGLV